eukprot:scaffold18292_cov60-Phaeocystis_antarctica.AAC.2
MRVHVRFHRATLALPFLPCSALPCPPPPTMTLPFLPPPAARRTFPTLSPDSRPRRFAPFLSQALPTPCLRTTGAAEPQASPQAHRIEPFDGCRAELPAAHLHMLRRKR